MLPLRCIAFLCVAAYCLTLPAQQPEDEPAAGGEEPAVPAGQEESFSRFEQMLDDVALVGQYTVVGQDAPAGEERYEIHSVTKMAEGDYWMFRCRLQFGDNDLNVPLPLEVKWAGDTPVITVDQVGIPGLGVFDARVIIDGDRYAGTWQHGETKGHLMGVIQPASPEAVIEGEEVVPAPAEGP